MIIINIHHGLGNQLFQYAFARSLSYDNDCELLLDLSLYKKEPKEKCMLRPIKKMMSPIYDFSCECSKTINTNFLFELTPCNLSYANHNQYGLNNFNINENILTKKDLNEIKSDNKINFYNSTKKIIEYPTIEEEFGNIHFPAYFRGSFQSENYFIHNEDIIRKDLEFKTNIKGKDKEVSDDINEHNSVALHIRRGDYLLYPDMGTCSKEYYENAVKFIAKNVKNPKFFIFSNDVNWVKQNVNIPYSTYYVTHNSAEKGHEDLRLMSLCDHFIIANSSFSWWGAWLSKNENKIVVKPYPWFFGRQSEASDIKSKLCYHIPNNLSMPFNNSEEILFKLSKSNWEDLLNYDDKTIEFNFNKNNALNLYALKKNPKIFFNDILKHNEKDDVIIKLKFDSKTEDQMGLYYFTKTSKNYTRRKSFPTYYHKNENLEVYYPITGELSLNSLMLIPFLKKGSEINIKSLEIHEIRNSILSNS